MDSMKAVIEAIDAIIADVEKALAAKPNANAEPLESQANEATLVAKQNANAEPSENQENGEVKPQKAKKKKEKKPKKPAPPPVAVEISQFLQCDLRVGKVVEVGHHPEGDILYVLKVSYGNETKSVCAGLREFIAEEDMKDRMVVTICNLKPRKLRGVMSEAMILAGSVVSSDGEKETVVTIVPPEGAKEGDIVCAEGVPGERTVVAGKNVSGKVWDKIVGRLVVQDGVANYNGGALHASDGKVTCPLPNGAEIH